MAVSAERLSRLVDDIYSTTTEPARWPHVLEQIASVLSSGTATLLVHDFEHATFPLVLTTKNFSDDIVIAYRDHFGAVDVLRDRSMQLGDGELGTEHQLAPEAGLRHCEVYWDLYVRNDMGHILGGYVAKEEAFGAVLALHRPLQMAEYGSDELRTSSLIVPHLARAIRLQRKLSFSAGISAAAMAGLDRASLAMFVVDRLCRVLEMNHAAEELLVRGDALQLRSGSMAHLPELRRAIVKAAASGNGDLESRGEFVSVGRMLVAVTPAPTELAGCAIVFVIDPEALPASSDEQLRRSYGLSPAETRIARLLCHGKSLDEIAEESGVSRETVRTHAKHLLAKTGTRRQSDLVSLLLRGVFRLGIR